MRFFKFFVWALFLIATTNVFAGTYTVTNTNDAGTGSLRQAITDANADAQAAVINFAITGVGPYTINVLSNFPMLTNSHGIVINGSTQASSSAGTGDQTVILYSQNQVIYGLYVYSIPATIKSLTIRNFKSYGILVYQTHNLTIDHVEIDGMNISNSEGIDIKLSDNFDISNCAVYNTSIGLNISNSTSFNVEGNAITGNTGGGVKFGFVDWLNFKGNTLSNNGNYGITVNNLSNPSNPTKRYKNIIIEDNTIQSNSVCGLDWHSKGEDCKFINNKISQNLGYGIYIVNSTKTEIRGNLIFSNTDTGIYCGYSDSLSIYSNIVGLDENGVSKGNGGMGIGITMGTVNIVGGANLGNTIANNQNGVVIAYGSKNFVGYNKIYNNTTGKAIGLNIGPGNLNKSKPTITSINGLVVSGSSEAGDRIQVFYNDGVAQNALAFAGETITKTDGSWSLTITLTEETYNVNGGNYYVATATSQDGNTSELGVYKPMTSCIVTTTEDNGNDSSPIPGSLRAAINCANAKSSQTPIYFALSGEGPYYFNMNVQLPSLNNPNGIVIDGNTQVESKAGVGNDQRIILKGTTSINGIDVNLLGANNTIKKLELYNFDKAIYLSSRFNIVTNCIIKSSNEGVELANAYNNILENDLIKCQTGIVIYGSHSLLDGNQIGEANFAITASGGLTDININNNYIGINKKDGVNSPVNIGIMLYNVEGSTIKNNLIGNATVGIKIDQQVHGCTIENNHLGVTDNGAAVPLENGIVVNGYIPPGGTSTGELVISKNFIANCGIYGIQFVNVINSVIKENYIGTDLNNKVYNNGDFGIFLAGSGYNQIESNHIFYHKKDGIVVTTNGLNSGENNLITKNFISNNGSSDKAINIAYLGSSGNNSEPKPTFNPTQTIDGSNNLILSGTSSPNRQIEIFTGESAYQSATTYRATVTANNSGVWSYSFPNIQPIPYYFAATATDVTLVGGVPNNNTSELSSFYFCSSPAITPPTFTALTFCEGKAVAMNMESMLRVENPAVGLTYLWDINNDNDIDFSSQTAETPYTFTKAGQIPVKLTAKNGCNSESTTATIDVMDFSVKSPAGKLCKGQSLKLQVAPAGFPADDYVWFRNGQKINGVGGDNYTITQSGTYKVIIKSLSCVTDPSEFEHEPGASIKDLKFQDLASAKDASALEPNYEYGNVAYARVVIFKKSCPEPPPCGGGGACTGAFYPVSGKSYVLSVWVKEESTTQVQDYLNAGVKITFDIEQTDGSTVPDNSVGTLRVEPGSPMVDGWQKLERTFTVPDNMVGFNFTLESSPSVDIYYDDLRIQHINSSMKAFVYDPNDMKLMSELDERNFATYYEYDQEGQLIRVKKETERGIMTIQESQTNIYKDDK